MWDVYFYFLFSSELFIIPRYFPGKGNSKHFMGILYIDFVLNNFLNKTKRGCELLNRRLKNKFIEPR